MRPTILLATLVGALCGDPSAQAVTTIASQQPPKSVTELARLGSLESWSDRQETMVIPASAVSPSTRVMVQTKAVYYDSGTVAAGLALVAYQGTIYIVRRGQSFYFPKEGGLVSGLVDAGLFVIRESLYRAPESAGLESTLAGFVAAVQDERKLFALSRQETRIDLTRGVPFSFWTALGGLDAHAAMPRIYQVELTGNGLRLDLGGGGRQKGTFWLDIDRKVVTRTEIDGKVVFTEK